MPAIVVTVTGRPADPSGPIVAGVTFRRPSSRSESFEPVRQVETLANGDTRTYDRGRVRVVSLSWAKLTEAEVDALSDATAAPFVTYREQLPVR